MYIKLTALLMKVERMLCYPPLANHVLIYTFRLENVIYTESGAVHTVYNEIYTESGAVHTVYNEIYGK